MRYLLFLFISSGILLFSGSSRLNAQCVISNLQVETGNCVDNDHYSFTLNFFISGYSGENFDVFVNGAYLSTHHLNERPLTIENFLGHPSGTDTLTVCATGTDECCASKVMTNPCPCSYFNIEYTTVNCTEDSIWFELDFDYINVQDSFHVGSVGNYLGMYNTNELPVLLGPVAREQLPKEVLIASPDFFCFESFELTDDFCESCLIHEVNAIAGECNQEDYFPISIQFLHRNTGGEGFKIQGNGTNYGNFTYSNEETAENGMFIQTVDLGFLPGDCETIWEFAVIDLENPECRNHTVLQPVCCSEEQCSVGELVITEMNCTSVETIEFFLNFEYSNPGSDHFDLYLNDYHVGFYPLSSLPLFIEELQFYPNGENVLKVCINDQPDCCSTYTFENLDCFGEFCELGEVEYSVIFTNDVVFYVQLDFDHNHTGSEGFNIRGNGKNYGVFFYENLPVLVGPFDCRENIPLEFGIRDVEYPDCQTVLELGAVPCETSVAGHSMDQVYLHYNFGKNILTIVDQNSELIDPQFRIYNIIGQTIPLTLVEADGQNYHLHPVNIQSGVYYIQVLDQGKYRTFKYVFAN